MLRTIIFHVQRCWRIVVVYSVSVVQKPADKCEHIILPPYNTVWRSMTINHGCGSRCLQDKKEIFSRKGDEPRNTSATHRMLLTSLPTFAAYAPCNLLSFVFLLILKNTSSPVCVVTCTTRSESPSFTRKGPKMRGIKMGPP